MNRTKLLRIRSIGEFHRLCSLFRSEHPLVSIIYRSIFYILIPSQILLSGCKSLSKAGNHNIHAISLKGDNFKEIEGTYSNSFDTIAGKIDHYPYDGVSMDKRVTILSQLFHNYPDASWIDENNSVIDPKDKWIKIVFESKRKATVSMYNDNKFVFSKNIRGKFKNGYFYLRPKIYVIPLVPLVFAYNFERARMGKTINNDLIIDYTVKRWGFSIFSGSEDKGAVSSVYKRKK